MKYRSLNKWHIWLGWLVGVPLILWTLSGLVMVITPIEQIRGEHLRAEMPPLPAGLSAVAPEVNIRAVASFALVQQPTGPVWVINFADGGKRRADAMTGKLLPPVTAMEAGRLAQGYYKGAEQIRAVRAFTAQQAPFDLRRERPGWQVGLSDETRLYIDRDSAELIAIRTPRWRIFDFFWGLHIMDLQTREDTSHPTLIGFAALSLIALLAAFAMQLWRQRRRDAGRKRSGVISKQQETAVSD